MANALVSATKTHRDTFTAIHNCTADDSDFAVVRQTMIPLQEGEQPQPPAFYAQTTEKMLNSYVVNFSTSCGPQTPIP